MIVYKTTNLINGKVYIGKDRNNNPKYLGSGILLQKAIKKYGKENFIKETLFESKNEAEINEVEKQEIKKITTSQVNNSARPSRNSTFSMSLNLASGPTSSKGGVAIGGGPAGLTGIYFEANDVDEEASALNEVRPRYPIRAEREGVAGKVSLLLKIDYHGRVVQVKVQSVSPPGFGFEKAAMEAIKKTKFSPAKKDGVPVSQKRIKEFVFDY